MTNDNLKEVFADGIVNVSHANGVFRITFGQQEPEGAVNPIVKLIIPGSQIAPVIQSLTGAVNDIASKIQEKTEEAGKQKKPAATKPAATKSRKR